MNKGSRTHGTMENAPQSAPNRISPSPQRPRRKSNGIILIIIALIVGIGALYYAAAPSGSKKKTVKVVKKVRKSKPAPKPKEEAPPAEEPVQVAPEEPEPAPAEEPQQEETPEPAPQEEEEETVTEDTDATEFDLKSKGGEANKAFTALFNKLADAKEYAKLKEALHSALQRDYPTLLDGFDSAKKVSGKVPNAARAASLYQSMCYLDNLPDDIAPEEKKAFTEWFMSGKKRPVTTFAKYLVLRDISEEDGRDMMITLFEFHHIEPAKAYNEIRTITNPSSAKVSKRFYPHTKQEMKKELEKILKTPAKGRTPSDQQEAINRANAYRYICGVNPGLTYNSSSAKDAQNAAEACKKAGHIAHDLGHDTDKCNLTQGVTDITATVDVYMEDPGDSNRAARGHRAWVLTAGASRCGFGIDDAFSAMRTDPAGYKRLSVGFGYPNRGFFPSEYMLGNGWSYYYPAGKRATKDVKVEMWRLPRSIRTAPSNAKLAKCPQVPIEKIHAHTEDGVPLGHSIVFEPDYSKMRMEKGKPTGTYWVRITDRFHSDEYVVDFY